MDEFEKNLTPDKFNLDNEWEDQAMLADKYGKAHARAVAERDRIWQKRKVIRAELLLSILDSYNKKGLKKPNDTAIDAEIRITEKHQNVSNELIEANEKVALTESAKWAIPQKRDALENLTSLFLSGYWADQPKKRKEAKREFDEKVNNETTTRLKKQLRRRTKE